MSYFDLRKRAPEPESNEGDEEPEETEETEEEPDKEGPKKTYVPIVTGFLGPGQWIATKAGTGAAWTVHIVAVWAVGFYGGWIAAGVITAWLVAVLAFVPRESLERAAAAVERRSTPAPEPPAPPTPGGEREAVRRLLLDVMGDAPGVHLKTVLAHLQEHGQWEDRKVADLRVHLEALGIPVDPKLKVAGVPTRGVLRTAIEALPPVEETSPSPTPSPPV